MGVLHRFFYIINHAYMMYKLMNQCIHTRSIIARQYSITNRPQSSASVWRATCKHTRFEFLIGQIGHKKIIEQYIAQLTNLQWHRWFSLLVVLATAAPCAGD